MSLSAKMLKNRILDRKDRLRKTHIKEMIINNYLYENPYDSSIYKYFHMKRALENKICSDNIWEVTRDGFEARTDFRYDASIGEIKFTRNRIIKKGDKYISNGTVLAERHLKEEEEHLDSLIKLDRIINDFYKMYKKGINRDLPVEDPKKEEQRINSLVAYDLRGTKAFVLRYKDMGLTTLIRWLNKLSDVRWHNLLSEPSKSTEQLLDEFMDDMNNVKTYFEAKGDPLYLEGKEQGLDFEKELLKELEKYSPRGSKLKSLYLIKKRRERGIIK